MATTEGAGNGAAARLLGIDPRSLAAFRIGIALVLLWDLLTRAVDLRAHYTDWGVVPREILRGWVPNPRWLLPHLWGGGAAWEAFLFALSAVLALALLVGYRTRLVTVLSWYLLLSLQLRNPALMFGGDKLLRMLLLWSCFLPLGACWSLDARTAPPPPRRVRSVATVGILLQLCLMYWITALRKSGFSWTGDFTAIERALELDHLVTPWGIWLRRLGPVNQALTAFTLALEYLGPLLVWSPVATAGIRTVVIFLFVMLHLVGIAPAFDLGIFSPTCAVAWLLFVPSNVWDQLAHRAGSLALPAVTEAAERPRRRPLRRWAHAVGAASLLVWSVFVAFRGLYLDRTPAGLDEPILPGVGAVRPRLLETPGLDFAAQLIGLDQSWRMFSPDPPREDGWYVMVGKLASGRVWDVWNDRAPSFAKPTPVVDEYRNARWNKYLWNLTSTQYDPVRGYLAGWLCRAWNERHEDRAVGIDLLFVLDVPGAGPSSAASFGRFPCAPPDSPGTSPSS